MLKPRPLTPGDMVTFVTPASPIKEIELDRISEILSSEGYRTKVAPHALESAGYLAGADKDRAQDLQDAFDDPETSAVICTRGGYGCARLFPYLDLDRIARSRKLFLGYSDITTLHLALNRRGMPTLHTPMAITLHYDRADWVAESFKAVLKGDVRLRSEAPLATCIVRGVAEGEVVGGCLCLITDAIGTPESPDFAGKLVVIEDVDESPHRIDAMLTHLLNSGIIQRAAGIVMGEMTRTDERVDEGIGGIPWREIVRDRLAPLGLPFVTDFPFGHYKNMLSVPLGIKAKLDADAGTLTYLEPFCES